MTGAPDPAAIAALQDKDLAVPAPLCVGPLSPAEVSFMPPLLRSLSTLLRLRGKPVSAEFLLAGLAGMGKVTPGACLRAAERAGLSGRILYREKLDKIPALTLPCILLLTNDRA
ncbi:MAG: type I secretion system permease/ATPase, partial [Bilophila sp.]